MSVLAISMPLHKGNDHNLFAFVKHDKKKTLLVLVVFFLLLLLISYATRLQHILSSKKTGEETVFFGNTTHWDGARLIIDIPE